MQLGSVVTDVALKTPERKRKTLVNRKSAIAAPKANRTRHPIARDMIARSGHKKRPFLPHARAKPGGGACRQPDGVGNSGKRPLVVTISTIVIEIGSELFHFAITLESTTESSFRGAV